MLKHVMSALLMFWCICAAADTVDVTCDLTRLGIFERNAVGDGAADDSELIQAAIDHVAAEGGTVFVPAGTYRVAALAIPAGVNLVGAGMDRTVFRAAGTARMFLPTGGSLVGFTAYGTPSEDVSGDNWQITVKSGSGGTSICSHIVAVHDAENVLISNVKLLESRYDCLYVAGSKGLRVSGCHFDRSGRNVVSLVGNDEDFIFSDCYFGSTWRLYHVDLEPNEGRWIRDGAFVNCTFDGRHAGEDGSDGWGRFLILTGHDELLSRNVTVTGCTFLEISVRVRGIFPGCRFIDNPVLDGNGPFFLRVSTNPVGELRDVTVRGNSFVDGDEPAEAIRHGVTFTGNSVFAGNIPEQFNAIEMDAPATTDQAAENKVAD